MLTTSNTFSSIELPADLSTSQDGIEEKHIKPKVCEFMPETVAYIVNKANSNSSLRADDILCLQQIAAYYKAPDGVRGFLKLHPLVIRDFHRLMRKSILLVDSNDESAHMALRDCMDMLIEHEFLRLEINVRELDYLLSVASMNARQIIKWRRLMIGFTFSKH